MGFMSLLDSKSRCTFARVALAAVGPTPLLVEEVGTLLCSALLSDAPGMSRCMR